MGSLFALGGRSIAGPIPAQRTMNEETEPMQRDLHAIESALDEGYAQVFQSIVSPNAPDSAATALKRIQRGRDALRRLIQEQSSGAPPVIIVPPLPDATTQLLDAGIRRTVMLLRSWGFDTCDSGDGTSKKSSGTGTDYPILTMPHVFCLVSTDRMVAEATRLAQLLEGVPKTAAFERDGAWYVETSYSPQDKTALVAVYEFSDAHWTEDSK